MLFSLQCVRSLLVFFRKFSSYLCNCVFRSLLPRYRTTSRANSMLRWFRRQSWLMKSHNSSAELGIAIGTPFDFNFASKSAFNPWRRLDDRECTSMFTSAISIAKSSPSSSMMGNWTWVWERGGAFTSGPIQEWKLNALIKALRKPWL